MGAKIEIMYKELRLHECSYNSGIKVRIYPSSKQKEIIKLNSDMSRFFYNQYVALGLEKKKVNDLIKNGSSGSQLESLEERLEEIKFLNKNPNNLSKQFDWINTKKNIDPQTKYLALRNYKDAWNMWRKVPKSKPPTFKKKNSIHKYSTDSCKIMNENQIYVNKIGVLRISGLDLSKIHDELYVGKTTIIKDADDKYYLSATIASKKPFSKGFNKTKSRVGIDLNLSNFLVDSNDVTINNPKYEKKMRKKLAKEQRSLARKREAAKKENRKLSESKNYQKQRKLVASLYKKITNQRKDFNHKVSTRIVKTYDFIVAEDIRPSNMVKNHKLARAIADVSWAGFLTMLEYKSLREGKTFIKVDPRYTTQTCSCCGHIMSGATKIRLGVKKWDCPKCNAHHNRDHNAAKNILQKGLELTEK